MAILDLSNVKTAFHMADPDQVGFSSADLTFPANWSYLTPNGNHVQVTGAGMTFDSSGRPLTGTVDTIAIDIGNDNVFAPEIVIRGVNAPAATLDDGLAGFWRFLKGDDSIIGPSQPSFGVSVIFGDGAAAEAGDSKGGNDTIWPGAADYIFGDVQYLYGSAAGGFAGSYRGGDDQIFGDTIDGQQDIVGDAGDAVSVRLTGGNDRIVIQATLFGGATGDAGFVGGTQSQPGEVFGGNDIIFAFGTMKTTLTGDVGVQSSNSFVRGGADAITGGAGQDFIAGDVGNTDGDRATVVGGADTIEAGGGDDIVSGDVYRLQRGSLTGGNDTIHGGFGGDTIYGEVAFGPLTNVTGGADKLYGEAGNDALFGQTGSDILDGGAGADYLDGGAGGDVASYATAGAGVTADLAFAYLNTGDAFSDTYVSIEYLLGSAFNDTLRGNDLGNGLMGGDSNDTLDGRGGVDLLSGGNGMDYLLGGAGNDNMMGGADADTLVGGVGADRLDGGLGADRLFGDAGADVFVFSDSSATGIDRVFNFVTGLHKLEIDISDFGGTTGAFTFRANANPIAPSTAQAFLYDTDDGKLYFDADGTGAGARVHVLTLTGAPVLAAGDLLLV